MKPEMTQEEVEAHTARIVQREAEERKLKIIRTLTIIALIVVAFGLFKIVSRLISPPFKEVVLGRVQDAGRACGRIYNSTTKEFDDCVEGMAGSYIHSNAFPIGFLKLAASLEAPNESNWEGGQEVQQICHDKYGLENTIAYLQCVVDYIQPIPEGK